MRKEAKIMTVIIPSTPYSLQNEAKIISNYLGYSIGNNKLFYNDKIIAISNPDAILRRILMSNKKNVRIVYSVLEGVLINTVTMNSLKMYIDMYKPIIYTPSLISKFYHELSGIKINDIIHHAIQLPANINNRYNPETKVFSYASGNIERKYPKFLKPMFEKMKQENKIYFYIKGKWNVVYKNYVKQYDETMYNDTPIENYYLNIDVFVNLSGAGGFERMPLEALSYGIPAIIPDIPLYRETILQYWNNYPLRVKSTKNYYIWNIGDYNIPIFEYDIMEMYDLMKQINDMNKEQYYDLKMTFIEKGRELVAKHYPISLYDRFKNI